MAKKGDILLSVRAPVGTLNIAPEECAIGRGLSALRSKSGSSSFLFQVLQNLQQVFARRNGDGTTFGSINRDDLRSLQLAYPSEEEIVRSFDRIVSETEALIFANHQQNQELTTLRDWLLPMLMNGQVRVG
jgi:type I restriction enzyme S subunit